MPRPNQSDAKRREFLPVVARAFAELGYRRTTTAQLAARCGVQENILYRLWPDKKAMFIASIEYLFDLSASIWGKLLAEDAGDRTTAELLLAYEAEHIGEFGNQRIIFAGLSETDDPQIRAALAGMYQSYHRFVREQIAAHQARRGKVGGGRGGGKEIDATLLAWAVIGLGTVTTIARELDILGDRPRKRLMSEVGGLMLKGRTA